MTLEINDARARLCPLLPAWALRGGLFAGLIALSACSLGPMFHHPAAPVPVAWTDQPAAAAWPSEAWWRDFSSPDLDALMARARIANFDIAAAVARVREADAQARIAGAALLPQVSAGMTATQERAPVSGLGMQTGANVIPLVTASYELDFWGKNRAAREAAEATAQASRYDRVTVELTIMTGVAGAYFQALELNDRISVAEGNLKAAEGILKGLKAEMASGTATALDVAQQDSAVATVSATIPPLRQQLRQTVDALAILTGQTPEALPPPHGTLRHLAEPAVRPGLPSELLLRRPDVAEAEADLVAANANIKVARASFFPSIGLTASGGFESSALATVLRSSNAIFALTAGIVQPIFEGGALEGQYAFTKARYDELLANYHKSVISAFGNVEDALAALRQTADQRQRQQKSAEKARLAYDLAMTQFHAGTINIITVLNTENAMFVAEDALAQVRFAHLQAILQMYNALGGGWQQTQEKKK